MKQSVAIIGGGISGLIAAYELEQGGFAPTIYEKQNSLGGRVRSDHIDAYVYDHGFQVLLTGYPEAQKYLNYEQLDLQYFLSGSRVRYHHKTVRIGDPLSSAIFWLDALDPTLSTFRDKIKTLQLSLKLKRKSLEDIFNEPELTTADYLLNLGFTKRVIERFFKPFFGGIFLETELKTSSRLFEFLFKMFANGHSVIPRGGMQKITDQLASKLSATRIELNVEVQAIDTKKIKLADGRVEHPDHIIIATDSSTLLQSAPRVQWKRSINFYFEVQQADYKANIITLSAEPNRLVNNYYYPTNLIPHPQGKTILSATVIDDRGLDQVALTEKVKIELKEMGVKGSLIDITSYDIPYSLPDIDVITHALTSERIRVMPGVYTCGDHLLMGSLNAAMYSGRYVAEYLINHIDQ